MSLPDNVPYCALKMPPIELRPSNECLLPARRRRWRRSGGITLYSLGQQAQIVDASGADLINHLDDLAVLGARIAAHEDGLVDTVGNQVLHLIGYLVELDFILTQV